MVQTVTEEDVVETHIQNNLERSETKPPKRLLEEPFGEGSP